MRTATFILSLALLLGLIAPMQAAFNHKGNSITPETFKNKGDKKKKGKKGKKKKGEAEAQEMELSGKLTSKTPEGETAERFYLVDDNGKEIELKQPSDEEMGENKFSLKAMVGKKISVKVMAKNEGETTNVERVMTASEKKE